MKMLLVSNMYPSKLSPGSGVFVKNFKDSLSSRGVDIDSAVIEGRKGAWIGKLFEYFRFVLRIYFYIFSRRYDVVYVHYVTHSLFPLLPILWFKKINLIVNAHGEDLLPSTRLEAFLLKMNRGIIERAKLIVVPSNYFEAIAISLFPRGKIFVSPSAGVDLNLFCPRSAMRGGEKFVLGYVSRIEEGKGWDTFLLALCDLKNRFRDIDISAVVAGAGSQLADFHRMLVELDLCDVVDYIGAVNQDELPCVYSSCDLFIFPTKLPESLGLVGIEALACGVPAVCSSIGGITTYMVDGVNGYTFTPGEHSELVEKVIKYIELCSVDKFAMKASARKTARDYCHENVADMIFDKIKEASVNES